MIFFTKQDFAVEWNCQARNGNFRANLNHTRRQEPLKKDDRKYEVLRFTCDIIWKCGAIIRKIHFLVYLATIMVKGRNVFGCKCSTSIFPNVIIDSLVSACDPTTTLFQDNFYFITEVKSLNNRPINRLSVGLKAYYGLWWFLAYSPLGQRPISEVNK